MKYFATNILPSRVARTVGVRHCPVYILVIYLALHMLACIYSTQDKRVVLHCVALHCAPYPMRTLLNVVDNDNGDSGKPF